MVTFAVMSTLFIRQYIPPMLTDWPAWLRAWVLHCHAACAILRFHFTFAVLLQLEKMIIESERQIQSHPPYAGLWIPKAHWILHIPHDIYRFGAARLLWVFLKEMKNAAFKRGCKRSNYFNPVKSTAGFWCEQSDYQLQQDTFSRDACSAPVIQVSGRADSFASVSEPVRLMLQHGAASADSQIDFLSSIDFHGVKVRRGECLMMAGSLLHVQRIISCGGQYCLWLCMVCMEVIADVFGSWSARLGGAPVTYRLKSLHNGSEVTCVYTVPSADRLDTMHVIVKI